MFDFSRVTEMVGGLIGQHGEHLNVASALEQLAGIDASQLSQLGLEDAAGLLAEQGIDLANLDTAQLAELASQYAGEGPIAELIASVIASRTGGGG